MSANEPNPPAETPPERQMYNLEITMKRGTWKGCTLLSGGKLSCAAQIMNLLDEGCNELNITVK